MKKLNITIKSINLIVETQAYQTIKDLVCQNEAIEHNNIIKQTPPPPSPHQKKLMMLQVKTEQNTMQIGRKYLIIHREY